MQSISHNRKQPTKFHDFVAFFLIDLTWLELGLQLILVVLLSHSTQTHTFRKQIDLMPLLDFLCSLHSLVSVLPHPKSISVELFNISYFAVSVSMNTDKNACFFLLKILLLVLILSTTKGLFNRNSCFSSSSSSSPSLSLPSSTFFRLYSEYLINLFR